MVAIDAHTGDLATFDRDAGADLVDAVTASTALPGSSPTISINGTHYINGGVRSAENADLASSYTNVVVLSPFGGRSRTLPEAQFEGYADHRNGGRTWRARSRPCVSRAAASK